MTAEEILKFAHERSVRARMKSSLRISRVERTRMREITRLKEFVRSVKSKLRTTVESFPSMEHLHPFYLELAEILVGIDRIRRALGAIYNSIPVVDEIANRHIEALKLASDYRQMKRSRSAAKGRIASVIRRTAANLQTLIEARQVLAKLPSVTPDSPTVVCAGFPNVGKSTLVRAVSTAEPTIAYYPFTTREVIVGHLMVGDTMVQVVDTPGILDRPMSERNDIERAAIAALKYLAHVIIFMVDPSETCGWPLDEQFNLYDEIGRMFPLVPICGVINKVDIAPPHHLASARERMPDAHEIVAKDGQGVIELMTEVVEEADVDSNREQIVGTLSFLDRETDATDS